MLFRSLADQTGIAQALHRFGCLAYNLHDVAHAVELFQQSLQGFRAVGDQLNIANVLSALAHVIGQQQTANEQVTAYLDESLTIYRSLGYQPGIASVLKRQGLAAALAGNDDEALALLGESLAIYRQTGAQRDIAWTLEALGETEWLRRNLAAARRHLVEAQHLFTELGDKLGISLALHHLAQVERGEQHFAEATTLYQQCLHLSIELENRHMIARCLAGLGGVALGDGQPERAARLLAVAQALFDDLPSFLATGDRAEYDALIAQVRTALGETAFVQLWTEGRSLSIDAAVAYAF
jgi:tetratricopeptide (TPR) repeat protein